MWIHKKTGNKYEVVSENAKMKLPSGEWIESVIYKPLYENEVELFTREKKSFYEDFSSPKEQMEEDIKQWNNCNGHDFNRWSMSDEEYYICTDKDALNMNKLCFDCSTVCPFCKRVSKKEYDDFWEAYNNE